MTVQCPECGQMVSDTAKACPKCGFDVGAQKRNRQWLGFVIVFGLIYILVQFISAQLDMHTHQILGR